MAAAVLGLWVAGAVALAGPDGPTPWAESGDVRISLDLLPAGRPLTAGEPIMVRLTVASAASATRLVPLQPELRVEDAVGRIVASEGRPTGGRSPMIVPVRALAKGEDWTRVLLISAWWPPAAPGEYVLRAEFSRPASGGPTVLATAQVPVTLRPRDPQRLEARCQELFEMMGRPKPDRLRLNDAGGLAAAPVPAASALECVRDDVVLPYLDFIARQYAGFSGSVCMAIRRIGSPRAEALLRALAERSDEAGEAARGALGPPPDAAGRRSGDAATGR